MPQPLELPLDVFAAWLVFAPELLELKLVLGLESPQAARPPVFPSDHGGVDQQLLPAKGSTQSAFDHGRLARLEGESGRLARSWRLGVRRRTRGQGGKQGQRPPFPSAG